ncbi:GCN5 family acetyltransferase [Intrasporangium oryzae NRRL B-24470]|uniref:GCN5 family acetyltransferase n=1 Tax=Intrasporangium oryzae NRRL B-24470 TaxID=1386089 RepID=W9G8H8_9MICO|nr:GNAT family protein [Intrasporangium oryzae]EWT01542.1 GCN5 family acetyltransferase [Intrasporangium oryzae NRRL B-24470]
MRMPWRPERDGRAPWPVVLRDTAATPTIVLRPLRQSDEREWQQVRRDNAAHVQPWEPTLPPGEASRAPVTFRNFVRELDQEARADRALPWCIEVGGQIVGQVHVFGIVRAAQLSGAIGYWLAETMTGHGVATRAVALAIDHALGPAGLHRVEVNIRLENTRSLALVERLGLREEGIRRRFLHIDGAWRDHRSFAITQEELEGSTLMSRLSQV